MTIKNKSERNYRGKCLGWPVTSYGAAVKEEVERAKYNKLILHSFLSYSAIILNIVTIHAIRNTTSLPKTLKALLLSLAVTDVGVGLASQPFYASFLGVGTRSVETTFGMGQNMQMCHSLRCKQIDMSTADQLKSIFQKQCRNA